MTDATDKLVQEFDAIAHQYAPKVVGAALSAARIDAISSLVSGVVCAGIFLACIFFGLKFLRGLRASTWNTEGIWIVGLGVTLLIGIATGIGALGNLLDIWNYVALVHPELWIAQRAMGL